MLELVVVEELVELVVEKLVELVGLVVVVVV